MAQSHLGMDTNSTGDMIRNARRKITGSAKEILEEVEELPYPSVNEPALVHPWEKSLVRIKDGGVIDVMTGKDNGIRINPEMKTIDVMTRSYNHHTTFIRSFVHRDETHWVKNNWTIHARQAMINTKAQTIVNAKGDIRLNTEGDFHMRAKGNAYYQTGPNKQHFFS